MVKFAGGSSELSDEMSLEEFEELISGYFVLNNSLKALKPEYRRLVADSIRKVGDVNIICGGVLAKRSENILEVHGEDAYVSVTDYVSGLGKRTEQGAWWLLINSTNILDRIGLSDYNLLGDFILKVSSEDERFSERLAQYSKNIVNRICDENEDYASIVLESWNKVAEVSVDYSIDLAKRSVKVLKTIEDYEALCPDLFLIKSVRDQHGANIISRVVDSENPKTEKAYDKLYGRFF